MRATHRAYPLAGITNKFLVVHVLPFNEDDESPFVGLLQVEAA